MLKTQNCTTELRLTSSLSVEAARAAEVGVGVGTGILAEGLVLDCCTAAELGQCRNLSIKVSNNWEMLGLEH